MTQQSPVAQDDVDMIGAPINNASTVELLRYTILALIVGALSVLVLQWPELQEATVNYAGPLAMLLIALIGHLLLRRSQVLPATLVLVLGVCANVTAIAAFTGGIRSPTMVVYPVIILMVGWLVSASAAGVMAVLISLLCFGLWWAERLGILDKVSAPSSSIYLVHLLIICGLSVVLVFFVLSAYNRRLQDQAHAEAALAASEVRYRTLIEWNPEPILVHRDGTIVYVNPAAVRLFGAPDAQALMRFRTADLIHPDARAAQAARMHSIKRGESIEPMVASQFIRLDGSVMDVEVQGTAIDFDGQPAIHVLIRDISARKQMEDQIRQLAFHDSLTHLPNRRLLRDRLEQLIRTNRRSGEWGAMIFLDLDNFKPLNDRYGHAVGDLLLIEAAARLTSCVRDLDTVSRFGGDEFVVVLAKLHADPDLARHDANGVAEKIRASLALPYTLQPKPEGNETPSIAHCCSASLGVVLFSGEVMSVDDLLKWGDLAMYQAKAEGRNRICYHPTGHRGAETPSTV